MAIHVVAPDGTGDRQLLASPANLAPALAWSPDGKLLAYAQVPFASPGFLRLFVYDFDSRHSRELESSTGTGGAFAFAPDGAHLIAQAGRYPQVDCNGAIISIDVITGVASATVPSSSARRTNKRWHSSVTTDLIVNAATVT